jgi:hypothetical protein
MEVLGLLGYHNKTSVKLAQLSKRKKYRTLSKIDPGQWEEQLLLRQG